MLCLALCVIPYFRVCGSFFVCVRACARLFVALCFVLFHVCVVRLGLFFVCACARLFVALCMIGLFAFVRGSYWCVFFCVYVLVCCCCVCFVCV